jgi:putative thymidine phosphorylase
VNKLKLKAKNMNISSGKKLIAILNKIDAKNLDLHIGDRIHLSNGKKSATAILDITDSSKIVPTGKIGLFDEVLAEIRAKTGTEIKIKLEKLPESLRFIRAKLEGKILNEKEIFAITQDIVDNRLSHIELTYFISGCFTQGLNLKETTYLTKALIETGDKLEIKTTPVLDKHCIGGIPGNRTTSVVVPILLAAGYTMPKTSSRSITSPAGTADTMEVLTNVSLNLSQIKKVVHKTGGCMVWGGAVNLAPADDKIITVEHPLSIDAEGNLLSSILAKKGSVSASHVLIDIPIGKTAKLKSAKHAQHLKKAFIKLGSKLGMKILVTITDGSQPIGNGVGPSLEARDILYVLQNDDRAPQDLRSKALHLAAEMMYFVEKGKKSRKVYFEKAKEILDTGMAWHKMLDVINAQGKKIINPDKIAFAKLKFNVKATKSGIIKEIDNKAIAKIARVAGAPNDNAAGMLLHKHVGDHVLTGDNLYTIYAESKTKMDYAKHFNKNLTSFIIH